MERIRPMKLRLQLDMFCKRSLWVDFTILVQTVSLVAGRLLRRQVGPTAQTRPFATHKETGVLRRRQEEEYVVHGRADC